jgi:ankyrin repeat protein
MARLIIIFCCIWSLSDALAQTSAVSVYEDLERQYANIIGAQIAGGVCPTRTSKVVEKQRLLASALSNASATVGPKVLMFAVTANSLANVRRLNEAGASRIGDNGSLLHAAAVYADPPMLEYLVSVGFSVGEFGGASGPALIVAVTNNRLDNAAWLIEHGASVNATDTAGVQVLRHAMVCRDQTVVDFLLEAGAQPDEKTREVAESLGLRVPR